MNFTSRNMPSTADINQQTTFPMEFIFNPAAAASSRRRGPPPQLQH
jgi:hypothetical protein